MQFSPQLRTDGELVRVTITQRRGDATEQIILTEAQARSLIGSINARLFNPHDRSRDDPLPRDTTTGREG